MASRTMQCLSIRLGSVLSEIDIGSVESISHLIYNIHSINRLVLNMADKLYYLSPSPTTVQLPPCPICKMGCVFLSMIPFENEQGIFVKRNKKYLIVEGFSF